MDFRLRNDAREWFKHLEGQLGTFFDMYYFCLLAGFAVRRKKSLPTEQTHELVGEWIHDYKAQSRLLIALLISCELQQNGISPIERAAVRKEVRNLLDPLSHTHLSKEGHVSLNRYANAGFEVLIEAIDERPRTLDAFLANFHHLLAAKMHDSWTTK